MDSDSDSLNMLLRNKKPQESFWLYNATGLILNAECVWTYLFDSHPSEFITRVTSYFITSDSSKASETILDGLKLK